MIKKYEWAHADTCLPDYWSGHSAAHVSIPIPHKGMFLKDIKAAILNELIQGAVGGSDDNARLLSADWVPERDVKPAHAITRAAHAAVNRLKLTNGKRKAFTDIVYEENEDRDYDVYAYFVLVEI